MSWQRKELEDRYREREQQWQQTHYSVDAVKATPNVAKSCTNDDPSETEPRILRSANSAIRQMSQGSTLFKGNDSTHQIRSKRERSNEIENNCPMPSSLYDRKITRKSDPPKIVRVGRPATKPVIATQAPLSHKRASTSRDQVQGIKERDSKKKIWSR